MGLRAQVRTRDGWAIQHAVVTVTDMTGNQVLRAAADENRNVRTTYRSERDLSRPLSGALNS